MFTVLAKAPANVCWRVHIYSKTLPWFAYGQHAAGGARQLSELWEPWSQFRKCRPCHLVCCRGIRLRDLDGALCLVVLEL